jgi:DNA invertase Pin-like site-specific DNA recombinase
MSSTITEYQNSNKKEQVVLKIIRERQTVEGPQYLVKWSNLQSEWLNVEEVSPYTIEIYKEITYANIDISVPMENPKEALIYCRSSINQEQIEQQKDICIQYCKEACIPIEYLIKDDVSGRNMKNINYELGVFIPYLKEGNVIIVSEPDVLGRDIVKVTSFLYDMKQKGIDIHFVKQNIIFNKDTTPENKFKVRDILNKAELVSDKKSKSFRDKQMKLRKSGHQLGTPPFGMKVQNINGIRKFVTNKGEQKVVTKIMTLYKVFMVQNGNKKKQTYQSIIDKFKGDKTLKENKIPDNPNFIMKIVNKQLKLEQIAYNSIGNALSTLHL